MKFEYEDVTKIVYETIESLGSSDSKGMNASFSMDSLDSINLVMDLEKIFRVKISNREFETLREPSRTDFIYIPRKVANYLFENKLP